MSCFWASRKHLAIVVALVLVIWLPSTAGQCVFPDGSIAGDYYACPESKVCCLKGEACLSNGLCYAARYNIAYRGACTDKSWPNDDCPRACYNSVPNQWANLLTCSGTARGNFTCSKEVDGKTACEENLETWHWIGDSGVNVTTGQNAISLPSPIDEPSSSTTQVASASSQTSLEPSSLSGAKFTSIGPTTTSIGSSVTPASSNVSKQASATASDSTPPLSKSSFTLEIGLGVGLGVPLIILASVLALFCIRGRRQINACSSSHGSTIFYPSGHMVRVREAGYGPHELGGQKYIPELYG